MKNKIDWVDNAKGIGIVLVVFGHVLRGIFAKGLSISNDTFMFIDDIIYSFHMPLFFLISGFFINKSLSKYGGKELIINKAKTIMYPYFIWSVIQILINVLLSKFTNNNSDLWSILKIIYEPIAPFWYLYAVFLMYILSVIFIKIDIKLKIFFAAILYFLPNTNIILVDNLFDFYIYFILGSFLFKEINQLKKNVLILFLSVPFFLISFYCYNVLFKINEIRLYLIPALIGAIVVFSFSKIMVQNKIFTFLGNQSLVIFLLHIFFTAGTRIFLYNVLGISSVVLHVFLGVTIGLLGPLLFNYFYKKFNLKGLFVCPF
ncbi:acyltransferase family protein [Polaribacter sp. 20A6]|uniref:acyltransferase family protein n=1 Tax=Polaribacter sp. 20A6 TaxID=2687289 RepID=UPI0013FD8337|nr:acyltransferase [Polaribacter sp. 20A6]